MEGMKEKLVELTGDCKYWGSCEEMADYLIAHGVTMQQWVPVKDRLPDDGARVLVYFDDGNIRFGISRGGIADVVSQKYLSCNHNTVFSKATHWMPLPEPPEEG